MRPTCELLSPAGSFDIAKAVIDAGADAVYLAGDLFGARAYAGNLSREELFAILDYAHVRGTSIHLTVNTLLKNREIEGQLYDFILPLYEHGLDAVIVQDFGVLSFLHRYFPQLSLHASTQMSVADVAGALFLQKQGVSRVVTARELSLKEVAQIAALPGLEVETFIHGALCYSYSGQCLMSSMIGGRSGNRGRCAQPCRLPYRVMAVPDESGTAASGQKKGRRSSKDTAFETDITKNACYPLSPKDLCAINLLPELIGAGIHSFKIEGRMKQVEYAAGVTAMYRKYIDAYYADPQNFHVAVPDYEHLMRLGNRSGFTEGYYHTKGSSSMMALYDSSHTSKKVDKKPVSQVRKAPVDLYFNAMRGEPVVLTAIAGDAGVSLSGVEAAPASSRPTTEQDIKKQLTKLGDTPFVARSVDLSVDEGLFLPLSQINQLRRQVLSGLEEQIRGAYYRDCRQLQGPDKSDFGGGQKQAAVCTEQILSEQDDSGRAQQMPLRKKPMLSVQITRREQLEPVLLSAEADVVMLDFSQADDYTELKRMADRIHETGKLAGYCFPYIFRASCRQAMTRDREALLSCGFDRFLVRSYDSLGFCLLQLNLPAEKIQADHSLYVFSTHARAAFSDAASDDLLTTAPVELNGNELRHQNNARAELILYGRIPLMISAQCVYRNYRACKKRAKKIQKLVLIDRNNNRLPVETDCSNCFSIIRSQKPLYLLDAAEEISRMNFYGYRLIFTDEEADEVRHILKQCSVTQSEPVDSFSKYYTHGHFRRGVK